MNTIIIAALVLVVFVVIIAIFSGRMSIFGLGLKSCEGKGGECMVYGPNSNFKSPGQACDSVNKIPFPGADCSGDANEGKGICCISG